MVETFVTYLAWIFGVISSALVVIRVVGHLLYSETEKLQDLIRGFEMKFPITVPATIAIICWTWVIVN